MNDKLEPINECIKEIEDIQKDVQVKLQELIDINPILLKEESKNLYFIELKKWLMLYQEAQDYIDNFKTRLKALEPYFK